jgi:hypothetical protein
MLKMAVDMREDLDDTEGDCDVQEDADAGRLANEFEDAALDDSSSAVTRLKREKKRQKKAVPSSSLATHPPVMLELRIIMPRDEEVESSNEDNDQSEDETGETGRYVPVRPISRADMKSCALDLAQRRHEIEKFLGTSLAEQRERNRCVTDVSFVV